MTQLDNSTMFVDIKEPQIYQELNDPDTFCLVNYFKSQVITISKRDFLDDGVDIGKIMSIFGWTINDTVVDENIKENISSFYEGFQIIPM